MEYLNLINLGLGIIGAVIGGITTGFLARFFMVNYIKNNDNLHQEWRKDITEIKIKVSTVLTKMSGLDYLQNLVHGHDKKLGYLEARVDSYWPPRNTNIKN